MYSSIILLLSIVATVQAVYCPEGYKDLGDGICYGIRVVNSIKRATAYQKCHEEGAQLAVIDNMFTNVAISRTLPMFDNIWIGMSCVSLNSCFSDDGDNIGFQNFYMSTNVTEGSFVYVDNMGMWGLGDNEKTASGYVCQYKPNDDGCPKDYKGIGERCYRVMLNAAAADKADSFCTSIKGRLASIPSAQHNHFVNWLVDQNNVTYARIGLRASSATNFNWTDSSPATYNNFGFYDSTVGQCAAIAVQSDVFLPTTWVSMDCNESISFVCSADRVKNSKPVFTGQLPMACLETYFINNSTSGTITSPGYPLSVNLSNECRVIVTAPVGYKIQAFSSDSKVSKGYLAACDSYGPRSTCSSSLSTPFTTSNNLLLIRFSSNVSTSRWSINYTAIKQ